MKKASRSAGMVLAAAAAFAVAGGAVMSVPASAQFSEGYRFLEAVRKRDGTAVTEALDEPGTTIVNTRDVSTGESALHIVTRRRDLTWIRFLGQRGANVNVRNDRGETPLAVASSLGFVEGVEALLGLGARVDEANSTGETPLIAATHRRDVAMARALLKAGADPRRTDNSGRSAIDYAGLDGRDNPVLAEFEAAAAKKAARGTTANQSIYGPSF